MGFLGLPGACIMRFISRIDGFSAGPPILEIFAPWLSHGTERRKILSLFEPFTPNVILETVKKYHPVEFVCI